MMRDNSDEGDFRVTFPCGILSRFMSWIWLTRICSMLIRDSTSRCRSFAA